MSSGEKYNPENNTWSPISNMYYRRSNFAAEVIDDEIFVIGGYDGWNNMSYVECFDEKTNEWFVCL
jgi:hypothetical protein